MCYNKGTVKGARENGIASKKIKKSFKKPLTNKTKCAIIKAQDEERKILNTRKENTMTKMTYVNAIENAINGTLTEETIEKLQALKAQLVKRASGERKPTKVQRENEGVKSEILAVLTSEGKQCKEISEAIGISGQKCSALLKQLVESGVAEKYTEKRVTYFKAVEG
jgi:predicted transcriptional regulator